MADDDDPIRLLLKRRTRLRWIVLGVASLLAVSSILDHTRLFGFTPNLKAHLDRQQATVTHVIDGDTLVVRLQGRRDEIPIHLLGVDSPHLPGDYWADRAGRYTQARALNHIVTIKLDSIGWQNDRGQAEAYVFLSDGDDLNLDIIHDGQAYADRRSSHSLHASFEAAENEARSKKRGLWRQITKDQMPGWRQDWMNRRGY